MAKNKKKNKKTTTSTAVKKSTPTPKARKTTKTTPTITVKAETLDGQPVETKKIAPPQKEKSASADETAIIKTAKPAIVVTEESIATPKNNRLRQIVVICASLLLIAGIYWWTRRERPVSEPGNQPEISLADQYLATLADRTDWVILQTSSFATEDETEDGTAFVITEVVTNKLSLTPTLQVFQPLTSSSSANVSTPEIDEILADLNSYQPGEPSYTLYDRAAGTITFYDNYYDQWTYSTGEIYDSPAPYRYAQIWETGEKPTYVSPGALQARDYGDFGTYTFHFDPETYQLKYVDYAAASGSSDIYYQILDEPAITSIPDAIVDEAVEFDLDTVFDSDLVPTVGGEVYVPDDL